MVDLMLVESRQSAMRRLLAAEPIPGEPLPPRSVFDAVAELVPCDVMAATLTDGRGRRLQQLYLAPGPDHLPRPLGSPWSAPVHKDGDGPLRLGWLHRTKCPELAKECDGVAGVDDVSIGFRNGIDNVVQFTFVRESTVFSEEELALLRMLVPVFGRLVRERPAPSLPPHLTLSERRILHHVAAGRGNAEIAESLCVAESTVRKHLENSYRKLGVSNRMAAVARLRGSDRDPVDLRGRLETFA